MYIVMFVMPTSYKLNRVYICEEPFEGLNNLHMIFMGPSFNFKRFFTLTPFTKWFF